MAATAARRADANEMLLSSSPSSSSSSPSSSSQTATAWGSGSNLIVAAAGAGLLSFPYAVMNMGMGLALLMTVVFALFNALTLSVVVRIAAKRAATLEEFTYEETVGSALGRVGYWLAVASVLVGCFGALIGFLIIIADLGVPVMEQICADASSTTCAVVTNRSFVILCFGTCIALPLSFFEKIHSLSWSSVVAVLSVALVAVLVVYEGGEAVHDELPRFDGGADGVLWWDSSLRIMLGIPIVIFSLGNHLQVVTIAVERAGGKEAFRRFVREPATAVPRGGDSHLDRRDGDESLVASSPAFSSSSSLLAPSSPLGVHGAGFNRVILVAVACCAVLYLFTGIFGYLAFAQDTQGDILKNFALGNALADAAKLTMVLHIALAFPVVQFPFRKCIDLLWKTYFPTSYRAIGGVVEDSERRHTPDTATGDGECGEVREAAPAPDTDVAEGASPGTPVESSWFRSMQRRVLSPTLVQGVALIGLASLVAIFLPQVQVVFGLLGSIVSVSQIYGFPSAMLWVEARERERGAGMEDGSTRATEQERRSLVAADAIASVATTSSEPREFPDAPGRAGLFFDAFHTTLWHVGSPRMLRVQASVLASIGLLIAVIGSGVTVYETWLK